MGGMIVQTMAIEHPDRLLSVTSIMSTVGDPDYGAAAPEYATHGERGEAAVGSYDFDVDRLRYTVSRTRDRVWSVLYKRGGV